MTGIYPVVSSRISDQLLQQRILTQFDYDKKQLIRLQDQVSTGYRLTTPSDDAPAALRAITLQKILEQKAQARTNLDTTQSYLSASDNGLGQVADQLIHIRGQAVGMISTVTTEAERRTAAQEVEQAIRQLTDTANQKFRGRYLFAGSTTQVAPFSAQGKYIAYDGNELEISSYPDVDNLTATNIDGHSVFGAYSPEVLGQIDLNPNVTLETRLADLNAGQGVRLGSLRISDGTNNSTIDVSGAATVGDVIRLIEANPPSGRTMTARISASSLVISIDQAGGGNLTIHEVGTGNMAADLGILNLVGTGVLPIIGGDLNPVILPTTRLADTLGTRSTAYLTGAGPNNDIVIEALARGTQGDGYHFQLVDDDLLQAAPGLDAGSEVASYFATATPARAALVLSGANNNLILTANTSGTSLNNVEIEIVSAGGVGNAANVTYNSADKRLSIAIDNADRTQIQTIIAAINAEGTFTASYDASDVLDGGFVPTAIVRSADIGNVTGNTGNSGGEANTYFVRVNSQESTAQQVVTALQANADFVLRFQASIEGKDTTTAPFAGQGTLDISATASSSGGSGVEIDLASGIRIENGGQVYEINFSGAETLEDLLNILNGSAAGVLAEINETQAGINIRSRLSGADFSIGENGGTTAETLGIRSFTRQTALSSLNFGSGVTIASSGNDFVITRKDGVQFGVSLSGAINVGDVLDAINAHALNQDPATRVIARLVPVGNGIELVQENSSVPGTISLANDQSIAAAELGLIDHDEQSTTSETDSDGNAVIRGRDVNAQEVKGIFNTLVRLHDALSNFNLADVERAVAMLQDDFDRVNFARAELGHRQRAMDTLRTRLESEEIDLKTSLSTEIDVDFVTAVSDLTARQANLEATLRLVGKLYELNLLQFL